MTTTGLFISAEEQGGRALVEQARMGEEAGFTDLLVSDHYHPWNEAQGQAPFVWSVTGAIAATTSMTRCAPGSPSGDQAQSRITFPNLDPAANLS